MTELCLLSGLNALRGPELLIEHGDLEKISETMSNEIVSYGEVTLSHENLTFIVSSALALTLLPKEIVFYDRSPKLPEGVSDW